MSTQLFFWNVRGINDTDKHGPFCDWLRTHKPLFSTILETHIKDQNLSQLMNTLCRGWNYLSNHSIDDEGRIIVIWRDPVKVHLLQQSCQQITCEVKFPGSQPLIYTAICF